MGNLSEKAHAEGTYKSQTWSPAVIGDRIEGRFFDIETVVMSKGDETKSVVLLKILVENDGDIVANGKPQSAGVWGVWSKTMLQRGLNDKRVCLGDKVAFVFEGVTAARNNRKEFSIAHERTAESLAFQPIGIPDGVVAAGPRDSVAVANLHSRLAGEREAERQADIARAEDAAQIPTE